MLLNLEYIWLDGYTPEPNLRSKVKVLEANVSPGGSIWSEAHLQRALTVIPIPEWGFDGSSTQQAEGHSSDCILKPVHVYRNPFGSPQSLFVFCEVLNPDHTPHESNYRQFTSEESFNEISVLADDDDWWFGFEQEYTIMKDGMPLGFPKRGYPEAQGMYYCAVGHGNVTGREFVEEHLGACLHAGITITGTNAEVMLGQWEFQCFGKGAQKASDDLWMSRYILYRLAEEKGYGISFAPKPVKGDWNGNGMHTNFSNHAMRNDGGDAGKHLFNAFCETLERFHQHHIAVYGSDNGQRLTGMHETQHIDGFSYGISDRGASIRIPMQTVLDDWKGYLEDRRPASNADPYRVTRRIIETLSGDCP